MTVELTRLAIKPGKSERVDEWLATLNTHKAECIETLEREKMLIEAIFRKKIGDSDYLFWISFQDESPEPIETSPFPIDALHRAFGDECIDRTVPRIDMLPEVLFLAPEIAKTLKK